jgi:hypothetical protein
VLGFTPRGYYNYQPAIELTVHSTAKEQVTCHYGKQKAYSKDLVCKLDLSGLSESILVRDGLLLQIGTL